METKVPVSKKRKPESALNASNSATKKAKTAVVGGSADADRGNEEILRLLLRVGADTLASREQMDERLKQIKHKFAERQHLQVFEDSDNLMCYLCEYVPSRAMCYRELVHDLSRVAGSPIARLLSSASSVNVTSVGAGPGSEILAFGRFFADVAGSALAPQLVKARLRTLDIADWRSVHDALRSAVEEAKWFSAKPEADTSSGGELRFKAKFARVDVLTGGPEDVGRHFAKADLVTLLFVIDELVQASEAKTKGFFEMLASTIKQGSCLLVVDSAGDLSKLKFASGSYRWVYDWLDELLVGGGKAKGNGAGKGGSGAGGSSGSSSGAGSRTESKAAASTCEGLGFKLVRASDSEWFRFGKPLQSVYPRTLNNMRYFVRLYEKS